MAEILDWGLEGRRVRTPVGLLLSISDLKSGKNYEPIYSPAMV